jgi:hypothetical protein
LFTRGFLNTEQARSCCGWGRFSGRILGFFEEGFDVKSFAIIVAAVCALSLAGKASARPAIVADLSGDWSSVNNPNAANPNGTWEYREGNGDLPLVSPWDGGGTALAGDNQPAWAPSDNAGNFLPAEFQANAAAANAFGADPNNAGNNNVLPGDVIMHTNDGSNGNLGLGLGNYLFTSNYTGAIEIKGMVWDAGLNGSRPQEWNLLLDNVSIASGALNGAVSRSQAQTFDLFEPLAGGDTLDLALSETSTFGNFTGAEVTILAVPEPTSIGLLCAGLAGLAARRRR